MLNLLLKFFSPLKIGHHELYNQNIPKRQPRHHYKVRTPNLHSSFRIGRGVEDGEAAARYVTFNAH